MLVASVHHQPSSVLFNFETTSSNSFDKSVTRGEVCWRVSVVFTSKITFSLNLVPLYTTVSKNIVSLNFGGEFNSRGKNIGLLVRRKLRCLVYLCPTGKKKKPYSVSKQLIIGKTHRQYIFSKTAVQLPWVSETFHARFPVSVKSLW